MTFFCIAFSVICGVEAVANLMAVLSNVKSAVSDNGIIEANGEKDMLSAVACSCPLCNSSANILVVSVVLLPAHIISRNRFMAAFGFSVRRLYR